MRAFASCLLVLAIFFAAPSVQAHHPGHAVSMRATGQFNPFLIGDGEPETRLTYTFDWSHLDNSAGDVYLNQIEGEYSFFDWLSVYLQIPVLSLQFNFRPDKTGLGDIVLGVKGRVLEVGGHSLMLGNNFSFPSGNRNDGTGSGEFGTAPYIAYQYDFGPVQVFTSLGVPVLFDNNPEPQLLSSVGLSVPLLKGDVGLVGFMSLQGQTFMADPTFTNGSTKMYLRPGFIIHPTSGREMSLVFSGTVSVVDTLGVKPGRSLNSDSLALSQDILAGATFQFNYTF